MGRIVGIDLGTTNSVIAIVDMGGVRVIQNRENEHQTPSVVSYHKEEFVVGSPALRKWVLNPAGTVISIKRLIGRGVNDPEVKKILERKDSENYLQYEIVQPEKGTKDSISIKLGTKEFSPIEISSLILKKIKEDAEYSLGEKISHAVITVPAYFSDKQRNATREAGLKAGISVMKILDEPTAVAISFGVNTEDQEPKTVMVFDLGGGTFDISVLMMAAGAFSPLNLEGDMWLGGDDFDELIVKTILKKIENNSGIDPGNNSRFMATLKNEARKAKETLSSSNSAEIIIPGLLRDPSGELIDIEEEISRKEFESLMQPLLEKIKSTVKKAVENANFSTDEIDMVLMAGNSSSIPKIQELMEELFGKEKILRKIHPKQSVAIGAAMAAAVFGAVNCPKCDYNNTLDAEKCEKCGTDLIGIRKTKICPSCGSLNEADNENCQSCGNPFIQLSGIMGGIAPFNYGVQTEGDKFNVFISKGDSFETPENERIVQTFYTRFPNQRVISVPVYGGDDLSKASNNIKQGEAFSILPDGFPEGTPIKVKLWLDKDGSFIVDNFLGDGNDLEDLILRGDIDQKAVELMVEVEEKLIKKGNELTIDQKGSIDKKRNLILKKINDRNFEEALDDAMELIKELDSTSSDQPDIFEQAINMINYINHIITEYSWILGQKAYDLKNLSTTLDKAVTEKNKDQIQTLLLKIGIEITTLMQNSDLGVFLSFHGAINIVIFPTDPVEAEKLRNDLRDVEEKFRNNDISAKEDLTVFIGKFNLILNQAQQKKPEGKECPECGHNNPVGLRYCSNCKTDLWILGSR